MSRSDFLHDIISSLFAEAGILADRGKTESNHYPSKKKKTLVVTVSTVMKLIRRGSTPLNIA
jgi:hypothetical protein